MQYSLFVLVSVLIIFDTTLCLDEDYYWREYTGTVPFDAIIGGKDVDGKNVYIGQAYMKNWGLFVAEIFSGVKKVQIPLNKNMHTIDSHIKILCGAQENFYWEPANATNLHLVLLDKHAVIGGHVDNYGTLNIGRVSVEGSTKIGRILSYLIEDAWMFYPHKNKEVGVKSYEVLLYKKNDFDVRTA